MKKKKSSLEGNIKMGAPSLVDIIKIVSWLLIIAVYGYFFGYGDNLGQLKEVYLSVPHLIVAGVFFVILFVLNFITYKETLNGDLINYYDIEFYNSLGAEKKYDKFGKELKKLNSYILTCRFMKSLLPALKVVFILIAFAFGWGYIKSKFSVILFLIIAVVSYILNIVCSKIEFKFASGTVGRKISSVADSFKKLVLNTDNSIGFAYVNAVNDAKLDYIKKNKDCFSKDNIVDILNNIEKEKVEELKEKDRQQEEQKRLEEERKQALKEERERLKKERYKDLSEEDIKKVESYKLFMSQACQKEIKGVLAVDEEQYDKKLKLTYDVIDKIIEEHNDDLLYKIACEELKSDYVMEFDEELKGFKGLKAWAEAQKRK